MSNIIKVDIIKVVISIALNFSNSLYEKQSCAADTRVTTLTIVYIF